LALAGAAAWVRDHREGPLAGVRITARVIDHGLQAGSNEVAANAARQATQLGVPADVVRVVVETSGGLEAGARQARYAGLKEGAKALILLGHTLDDQAETVLLGLARGSGTRSLAGMPVQRDVILRPFLGLRRTQTEQACRDWGLSWWDDPTNADPAYTRSRLRQAMMTLEETLGPSLALNLARTATLCRLDADYLDTLVRETGIDTQGPKLRCDTLWNLNPALRHRVLLAWLRTIGHELVASDHVLAVDTLITNWHGQRWISVPGGRVVRHYGELHLTQL